MSSPAEIKVFQEQELKKLLLYLNQKSVFYRRLFEKNHIHIDKIRLLEDLQHIPPTTKEDLQQYGNDLVCVEKKDR